MRPEDTEAASGEAAQYDDELHTLSLVGQNLVDLGNALQDKNATVDELAALAFKAGLTLSFRITATGA